jgi:hypothetical protein
MAKNVVSFLIHDPDVMMWMLEFSLRVCSIESQSLVHSLGYLVSNKRQVLLRVH